MPTGNELTIRAPTSNKFVLLAIAAGIFSVPVILIFTNPVNEETPAAIAIAVAVPVIAYLYATYRHVVKIKDKQITLSSFLLIPHKPFNIAAIEEISSHRGIKNQSIEINLLDGTRHDVPTHHFKLEQTIALIHQLQKINPNIRTPNQLKELVDVFEDKEKLRVAIKEFEKAESNKVLYVIGIAAAAVFCIWLYKVSNGQDYSLRQLADLFISFVN